MKKISKIILILLLILECIGFWHGIFEFIRYDSIRDYLYFAAFYLLSFIVIILVTIKGFIWIDEGKKYVPLKVFSLNIFLFWSIINLNWLFDPNTDNEFTLYTELIGFVICGIVLGTIWVRKEFILEPKRLKAEGLKLYTIADGFDENGMIDTTYFSSLAVNEYCNANNIDVIEQYDYRELSLFSEEERGKMRTLTENEKLEIKKYAAMCFVYYIVWAVKRDLYSKELADKIGNDIINKIKDDSYLGDEIVERINYEIRLNMFDDSIRVMTYDYFCQVAITENYWKDYENVVKADVNNTNQFIFYVDYSYDVYESLSKKIDNLYKKTFNKESG